MGQDLDPCTVLVVETMNICSKSLLCCIITLEAVGCQQVVTTIVLTLYSRGGESLFLQGPL